MSHDPTTPNNYDRQNSWKKIRPENKKEHLSMDIFLSMDKCCNKINK